LDISHKAGVFKALDTWIERPVTIKVLFQSLGEQADQILLHEARALARLDHPNIVSVYDCVEYRDHLYLVREYVEGQNLRDWLGELEPGEPPPISMGLAITGGILEGLVYAHERGIIHRHIQSKNIIMSNDKVKIMNFGLADDPEQEWSIGDAVYMSPEQLAHGDLTARSDLYSCGILLYELVTGRPPFESCTVEGLIQQCMYARPLPPREINPGIPAPLERTILDLLAKDPHDRPSLAQEVLQEVLQELQKLELEESLVG
jgi:serine/threonine-protein kinase